MSRFTNDEYVFFLGAGASRAAGYPLMSTFLDDLKLSFRTTSENLRRSFETLLAFRTKLRSVRDVMNTDFDNIESLYSASEMFAMAFPDEELPVGDTTVKGSNIPAEIAWAIWQMCRGTPQKLNTMHSRLLEVLASPYGGKQIDRAKITFITTNYDLLIEIAAYKASWSTNYGYHAKFDDFIIVDGYCGNYITSPSNSSTKILKLHGSVNWFTDTGKKVYCDASIGQYQQPGINGHPEQYFAPCLQDDNYQIPEKSKPLIVPPTFGKAATSPLLQAVWQEAIQALSRAKMIVFIGYSFPRTDTFVTHLLNVGLLENPDLRKVLIFDPSATVDEYARKTIFNTVFSDNRLQCHPLKFEQMNAQRHETIRIISAELKRLEGPKK